MNDFFEKLITNITKNSDIQLSIYNNDDKSFISYVHGEKKVSNPPSTLRQPLDDENTIVSFFTKANYTIVIYFFRLQFVGKKYTLVLKDEKSRKNLNLFIANLLNISNIADGKSEPQVIAKEVLIHDDSLIKELQNSINKVNEELDVKNKEYDALQLEFDEMKDLVKVVKKSRDKVMTLVDGIFMPMYSMSSNRVLSHGNKALGEYVKSENISKVVGKTCHKTIFKFDEPCPWCQLGQVIERKENITFETTVLYEGRNTVIDICTFPITDSNGNIIDYGEFFYDKTDVVEMASSLHKVKEQIKSFKKTKINDMNEVQDVKKAYNELSSNYDIVLEKNTKITRALENLMGQDSIKDVLALKTEIAEYKNKILRLNDTIKNYQRNIEEQQTKYADLNRRVFAQMERFINIVNSKAGAKPDELKQILAFAVKELDVVKKYLITHDEAKKKAEAVEVATAIAARATVEQVENKYDNKKEEHKDIDISSEIAATLNKFTD